jgi:hypothetical protein
MGEGFTVGANTYPLAAGAALSAIPDPTQAVLLDFFAYVLNTNLNAKLAVLTPMTATAIPSGSTYAYDPGTWWPRRNPPSLYLWWKGKSTVKPWTTTANIRERELALFYVTEQVTFPEVEKRQALLANVDAILAQASNAGYHPSYSYGGGAVGLQVQHYVASAGLIGWEYTGGIVGLMAPVPAADARLGGGGEGAVVRAYPALSGTVKVVERVGPWIPVDPTDTMTDGNLVLQVNEEDTGLGLLDLVERVVPPWDGTEDE